MRGHGGDPTYLVTSYFPTSAGETPRSRPIIPLFVRALPLDNCTRPRWVCLSKQQHSARRAEGALTNVLDVHRFNRRYNQQQDEEVQDLGDPRIVFSDSN